MSLAAFIFPFPFQIFRGDVWHAGVGYPMENIRLHLYIESPLVQRQENRLFYQPLPKKLTNSRQRGSNKDETQNKKMKMEP